MNTAHMQDRHTNRKAYFEEQSKTVSRHVIPFLKDVMNIGSETSVLEIGCGEGGNLLPFLDLGCKRVVGNDISESKVENARQYFTEHPQVKNLELISDDIYNVEGLGQFDLIIMRDVIEHIHGQEKFMHIVKKFLKPEGKFFLGFPPWYNPFGGHQQICRSKLLSKLPYFHILPTPAYKGILKAFGENNDTVEALLEIKQTGISLERFERILRKENYHTDKKGLYFINPNYEVKFGLKPRKAWSIVAAIPFFRNFLITAGYYVVSIKNEK
ncbi:MAG: class I SAM-dependent methyltransferase [Flavobacteriales bacterium]|nr:class I SAM-dependent methyltransferase [Flavobacteriales bacterium]